MRVLALIIWFSSLVIGQVPTFRTGTSLVRVDAQVVRGGKVVEGLTQSDFTVLDEGKPQPILHFGFENDPIDLLLLIDKSGSMRMSVAEIAAAAMDSLSLLRKGDRVGIILFDTKGELLTAPTANMEEVARGLEIAVRGENIGGGTNINGAVFQAAEYMRRQPRTAARRSILILTDNRSMKFRKDQSVVRELWEADAVLNALIFQTGLESAAAKYQKIVNPWEMLLDADVKKIAEQVGGEWLRAGAPLASFREMLDRIRKRYTLDYRPPEGPGGKVRAIRLALTPEAMKRHPGAQVRARRGYISVEATQ